MELSSSKGHVEQLRTAVYFNLGPSIRQQEASKPNQINVLFFLPTHFQNNLSSGYVVFWITVSTIRIDDSEGSDSSPLFLHVSIDM